MKEKVIRAGALFLTAFIWGISFVAQSVGMEYIGPCTFNAVRFLIGGLVLIPVILILKKQQKDTLTEAEKRSRRKYTITGGILCGLCLCSGSTFQQFGILETAVGKAGFITALYIIVVPIIGIFFHKKLTPLLVTSTIIAVAGFYLLCISGHVSVNTGDILVLICAFMFALHILVIDYYSPKGDCVVISCIQFLVSALISGILMLAFENPQISQIIAAHVPILYAGIMSCGVAYTLQIVGQKNMDPTVASLIMSLESVFSALAGWVILKQHLSTKELLGCLLVFLAVILAQLPQKKAAAN